MNRSNHSAHPEKRSRLATLLFLGSLLAVPLGLYGAFLASADANTSTLPAVDHTSAQTPPTGCCSAEEDEDNKPHLLAASYYSVKKNLSAKLLLNNKGPRALEVKPTLFSLGGERYDISPITVDSNSFQMIDMREWIEAAGTQFQEGSIQVFHLGRDLVLGSQVYVVDERHSLSFEEKLVEPATFPSSRLQGLWWLPSQSGEVLLAVSNTSDLPVTLKAEADGTKPAQKASVTVQLGPHETRLMDVAHDIFGNNRETGDNRGTMSRFGALSVEHNGQSGAVIARGMAQDAAQGYSLAVQFLDPAASKSTKLQGAGFRLKEAGHEAVKPVVVAHNAGAVETTITGRLPYRASDGSTAIVTMPEVRLSPGETTTINVAKALKLSGVPDDVTAASIEFEYTNEPGSVLISALSVSDSGNQLFRLPLWDIAAQRSATGGYPWYIDGTSSTYVYLKNVTDGPQQYTFQLDFEGGGVYSLGLKTVEPRQAVTVDIRALRDEQTPDANGNTIPLNATRGQVMWSIRGPDALAMIGRSEQADTEQAVSNNYACQNCCGDSLDTAWKIPDTAQTIDVGGITFYDFRERDKNCYGQLLTPYSVNGIATWTSDNTSVATVSGGYVFGQGPGNTGIHGNWDAYVRYWQGGGAPGCRSTLIPMHLANGVFVAPTVTISEVGFAGDYQITRAADGVVIDNPDGSSPTWKSTNSPNHPVAYTKGVTLSVFGTLAISPSVSNMSATIQIKNGTTVIATKPITLSGTTTTVTGIVTSSALATTVSTVTPTFTWEISYDGGSNWRSMGNSGPHKIHSTYAAPLSPPFQSFGGTTYSPLYDLALEHACGAANGANDVATIVSQINQEVATGTFYHPGRLLVGHPLNAYANQCLCADLAALLRGLIRSIGIDGSVQYIWAGPNATTEKLFIEGNAGDQGEFNPSFRIIRNLVDGAPTNPHFAYHAVVPVGGTWYDPSYGLSYSSLSFDETAFMNTPQQTSTTFPAFATQSGWVCPLH